MQTQAYYIEICSKCRVVLNEKTLAPLVTDKGFSYYNGSIAQGYCVNSSSIKKYEGE